jgi:ParB-like chromosome segregation protein Spo0J
MKDLGWDEVDIAEVDITDVQSVSLGIALNRTAELAEWDDEILAATLNGLALEEGLLEAAGYDEEELAAMLAEIDDQPKESSSEEVDVDSFEMDCKCPRCGFEFDNKQA